MVNINTEGLEVAPLSEEQLNLVNSVQSDLNKMAKMNKDIYLQAGTRIETNEDASFRYLVAHLFHP